MHIMIVIVESAIQIGTFEIVISKVTMQDI